MGIIVKNFVLGPIENNNYLLIDEDSKEAVLIDCTEKSEAIDATLKEYGASLKYILLTHGHFDHILGVNDFKNKYGAKVIAHISDKELIEQIEDFAYKFDLPKCDKQEIDEYIEDGQEIDFAGQKIKTIHTPGHTQGGVCYLIGNDLFTGDTLFYESVGRTDLPGGDFDQLKSNIQEKLFTLDENIKVYPGHGWTSTIGHEKKNNQFL